MGEDFAHAQPADSFRLYQGWNSDLLEAELATYQGLDANAWLTSALALSETGCTGSIKAIVPIAGNSASEIFLDDPADARRLTIRLLRYLSSEQLFALIVSGQLGYPYARMVRVMSYDKITKIYRSFANRTVPVEFSNVCGQKLDIERWISVKLGDWEGNPCCSSLVQFLTDEAAFLENRTFVNALKHGRVRSNEIATSVGFQVFLDGEWVDLTAMRQVIWVEEWIESRKGGVSTFQHYLHAEDFEIRSEIGALYLASLMMRSIKESRIAYLEMLLNNTENCHWKINIPKDVVQTKRVNRLMHLPMRTR